MFFPGEPLIEVGTIGAQAPASLGEYLAKAELLSKPENYNYHTITLIDDQALPWWCRIDASLRKGDLYTNRHYSLVEPVLNKLHTANLACIKDKQLFAWSISRLNPGTRLADHTDGILRFRFCDRLIIPLSVNENSYNYYRDKAGLEVKTHFKIGSVYRLNNLHVHGAINNGTIPRDNILLDYIEPRLCAKFINHPDFYSLISPGGSDLDRGFFKDLLLGEVRSHYKYKK